MRRNFAIMLVSAFCGLVPVIATAREEQETRIVIWRGAFGNPVYEVVYRLTKVNGQPRREVIESYVYGPFAYRCMEPSYADHGGVKVRYYLKYPSVCYVPFGHKVCLERAHVDHHGVPVLPYLYPRHPASPCVTAIPNFQEPIFYQKAPLIPASRAELGVEPLRLVIP